MASEPPVVRFEAADVPSWLPLGLGAMLGGFVILVLVSITLAYPLADHQERRGPMQPLPPAPRLEVAPGADLAAYRASHRRALERAPTPLDAAIQATAAQGWGSPK